MLIVDSPYLVRLGTLNIHLEAGPSILSTPWADLTLGILRSFTVSQDDQDLIKAVVDLIEHPGINLRLQCRIQNGDLVIRISVLPSDALGSTWKRAERNLDVRRKALSLLFKYIKDGWDGGGRPVKTRSVSQDHRFC